MGDSLPPPAVIDLVGSFARRRASDAELVLWDPKSDTAAQSTSVQLTQGKRTVDGTVSFVDDGRGRRLVAQVPRSSLGDGQWSIKLIGADGTTPEPVEARLLVQGKRPLVLLWGAKGTGSKDPGASVPASKRVARAGVGALDSALSLLPPDTARGVRRGIRKAGARVLG